MTPPTAGVPDSAPSDEESEEQKSGRHYPVSSSESIAADVEAALMASGRTLPVLRLAVALGLISEDAEPESQEIPEGGRASASEPANVETIREFKPNRRPGKSRPDETAAVSVVEAAIQRLNTDYEKTGRAFRIERIAGGYRYMTLARHARAVAAIRQVKDQARLSRPAIETLAIIAYRQPVTRAELEAIRGVSSGEVVRSLMERRLVAIVGRSEELGRPMLYGTTRHFLDAFGLSSLKDLPTASELKASI